MWGCGISWKVSGPPDAGVSCGLSPDTGRQARPWVREGPVCGGPRPPWCDQTAPRGRPSSCSDTYALR